MFASEKRPSGVPPPAFQQRGGRRCSALHVFASSIAVFLIGFYYLFTPFRGQATTFDKVQKCAIDNLNSDLSFLDSAVPIAAEEFLERRDRLAQALAASNLDAFVLEPGYTFQSVSLRRHCPCKRIRLN